MKETLVMRNMFVAAGCAVLSIAVVTFALTRHESPPPPSEEDEFAAFEEAMYGKTSHKHVPLPVPEHDHDGTWAFAKDLWSVLGKQEGNVVFSPYGTARALELVKAGARGKTRAEIETLLHGEVPERVVTGVSEANHLWGQVGCRFKKGFKIDEVDFGQKEAACRIINDQVAKETKGHIEKVLGPDAVSPDTKLVATNALYMKATWLTEFDKSKTAAGAFHEVDGRTIQVPFMRADLDDVCWGRSAELRVIELPYAARAEGPSNDIVASGLVMDVIVPENVSSYTFALEDALALLTKKGAQLWLPRFETTSEIHLMSSLRALGLDEATDAERADFSGFSGHKDLAIQDVITETWIKVDEEGTEAASATAFAVDTIGFTMPNPHFRVDRPFYFAVRDRSSGSVFFTGRIEAPQEFTR
jgi:serpin B